LLMISFGLGGGVVGIGGSVIVLTLDNHTTAFIGDATVSAGGDVLLLATDETQWSVISGALAAGFVGVGASVGVTIVDKETSAFIDDGATVDAKGAGSGFSNVLNGDIVSGAPDTGTVHGVIVQAQSSEKMLNLVVAAGAGFV